MNIEMSNAHYNTIIVGGGQAGLSVSYYLQQENIDHLVLEKRTIMHSWKNERWDSFTLVTPNWQCQLPNHHYDGNDPKGFMNRAEIIDYLDRFTKKVNAPVIEGIEVERITRRSEGGYYVTTSEKEFTCDQVVVSSGGYHQPIIPRMAERLPEHIVQIHSAQYRNTSQLPDGAVLVVGCGQSGAQIAEDLHLEGKKVFLATGDAPRCARFYRGKDVVEWLEEMEYYKVSVDKHPLREGVRDNTNHYVTGRDGGRDIDLRRFASEGMELFGHLLDYDKGELKFAPNLAHNLQYADDVYNNINERIDAYIEKNEINAPASSTYEPVWTPNVERDSYSLETSNITSVIWCIGFTPDFSWLDAPVFNGRGNPIHTRGVTAVDGLYFIGLPWLHTWGSGRFSGINHDAEYLSHKISQYAASTLDTKKPKEVA
ncbi:MSMEG_0569 family flavin-dependent oxidoreductase [Vibrio sp. SCSIO 43169]|uniref:MSMEG_0569 family flavin-dependent oxidoreductase n=1 Tax=Vibrio sp. SCSIO 43169 TaxID=2822801 RepID=UPI0020444C7B|nr:MSMEG_0569 family flavin-dependent oxidoreductase [Vibrio sp. SCSIO 43169]MCM5511051.1 MSMEG_0569 family flavin-dependent oxidoreductase [Vibrio sp. SCSIO 43169]